MRVVPYPPHLHKTRVFQAPVLYTNAAGFLQVYDLVYIWDTWNVEGVYCEMYTRNKVKSLFKFYSVSRGIFRYTFNIATANFHKRFTN